MNETQLQSAPHRANETEIQALAREASELARELAEDIERYLHEQAVLARPPSQLYRLQKLVRRNRIVVLSGATAVAALLLGSIISTYLFIKEREALRTAETTSNVPLRLQPN